MAQREKFHLMDGRALQGILAPADAQLAVQAGVDGIILRCTQRHRLRFLDWPRV